MVTAPSRSVRRRAWLLVRMAVTSGLLLWIAVSVDWDDFRQRLLLLPPAIIGLVLTIRLCGLFLSSWKWQVLLRVHALTYPYGTLTRWYAIGHFLSQFLPSMIGGDGYRVYKTLGNGRHRACAVLPVFVERASGLLALLFTGTIAALLDWSRSANALSGWVSVVAIALAAGALVGVLLVAALNLVGRVLDWKRCPSAVRSLARHAGDYARHPREIVIATGISFVFQGSRIATFWLLLVGLGQDVGFAQVAVVTAVTTVIGMLPFSLGGIGLVDGSFIVLMTFHGVPEEAGLTVMLITRATALPMAMAGGLLYAFRPAASRRERPRPGSASAP